MFKIIVLFQSNETEIYTQHIETASDQIWFDKKLGRMLDYWLDVFDIEPLDDELPNEMKIEYINCHIDELNQQDSGKRKFDVTVLEF